MALGIRLDLKQSQQLVMTLQLQQAIKLLQMSNLELREFVEAEMESNPLIRVEEEPGGTTSEPEAAPDASPDLGPESEPESGETPLDARLTPEGDHSLGAETFDTGAENLYDIGPNDSGPNETISGSRVGPGVWSGDNRSGVADARGAGVARHFHRSPQGYSGVHRRGHRRGRGACALNRYRAISSQMGSSGGSEIA